MTKLRLIVRGGLFLKKSSSFIGEEIVLLLAFPKKDYHLYSDVRPSPLIPVNICRPLEMSGLTKVVQTAKECLGNNFVPAFLTIAGSVVAFHQRAVVQMDDSCPIIVSLQ